ncbi:MAG: hypothetical protein HYU68_01305 [Bacteroidetes bacterium]|nr:hypothetical protein [Bacteroidota bacterium]
METKIIDDLNAIYYIQQPLSFNSKAWEDFETKVNTCKQLGYTFIYLSFNQDILKQVKTKADEEQIENIEALTSLINYCEENIENDMLYKQNKEYQNFIFAYLTELKRNRDLTLAQIIDDNDHFKKLDDKTIQYHCCINEIYDYKVKHFINK